MSAIESCAPRQGAGSHQVLRSSCNWDCPMCKETGGWGVGTHNSLELVSSLTSVSSLVLVASSALVPSATLTSSLGLVTTSALVAYATLVTSSISMTSSSLCLVPSSILMSPLVLTSSSTLVYSLTSYSHHSHSMVASRKSSAFLLGSVRRAKAVRC